MSAGSLSRGQLARQGGVNPETIRYYERLGLLPHPPRTPAGYRCFPPIALEQVRFIKRAQRLGFSLTEVRDLLAVRNGEANVPPNGELELRLHAVNERLHELTELREMLLRARGAPAGPA